MITVALRYFDKFAPERGTIVAHQQVIAQDGFVFYGKLGAPLSKKVINILNTNEDKRFLLIHSGKQDRYWLYFTEVVRETPDLSHVPEYYRYRANDFHTWFKITRIDSASNDVMKHCFVNSSNKPLSEASRHSMSPYFIIRVEE